MTHGTDKDLDKGTKVGMQAKANAVQGWKLMMEMVGKIMEEKESDERTRQAEPGYEK